MAENIRTTPLRIRPSEYRSILIMGDLLMAVISVFASLYVWRQYNYYVILQGLLAEGVAPGRAEQRARILNNLEPSSGSICCPSFGSSYWSSCMIPM
jgi:hypothetical protein